MKYSFYYLVFMLTLMICSCSNPQQHNSATATEQSTKKEPIDTADTRLANDLSVFCTSQIKGGQLATTQASTQKVKDFGKQTIEIYTRLSNNLNLISEKYDIKLPATATSASEERLQKLKAIKGVSFDHQYLLQMLKQHNAMIREYNAAKHISCLPLKMFVGGNQGDIIKQAYAISDLKDKTP